MPIYDPEHFRPISDDAADDNRALTMPLEAMLSSNCEHLHRHGQGSAIFPFRSGVTPSDPGPSQFFSREGAVLAFVPVPEEGGGASSPMLVEANIFYKVGYTFNNIEANIHVRQINRDGKVIKFLSASPPPPTTSSWQSVNIQGPLDSRAVAISIVYTSLRDTPPAPTANPDKLIGSRSGKLQFETVAGYDPTMAPYRSLWLVDNLGRYAGAAEFAKRFNVPSASFYFLYTSSDVNVALPANIFYSEEPMTFIQMKNIQITFKRGGS